MAIIKPIILDLDGVLSRTQSGDTLNEIAGSTNPTWVVGGRGLLFDDGTSTAPGGNNLISLQRVYDLTVPFNNSAEIRLMIGKDFVLSDDTNADVFFKVDAETGKVTITGDLEVLGTSTVVDTVVQDVDHWLISPNSGSSVALTIEPDVGVTQLVDLLRVRNQFGGTPVLRITSAGDVIATQNLTLGGLLNGIDIALLEATVNGHILGSSGFHIASHIEIAPIAGLPTASNTQEALEQLDDKISANTGSVTGYSHPQPVAGVTWFINHGLGSLNVIVSVYDEDSEQIIPDNVKILDVDNVLVSFGVAQAGKAVILAF